MHGQRSTWGERPREWLQVGRVSFAQFAGTCSRRAFHKFCDILSDLQFSQHLQLIITTALEHQKKAESVGLRLANLEVLINAVLYNPSAALHFMELHQPGTSRVFFDEWFAAINSDNKLPRVHDKRLSIVALSSLMEMDPSSIPDILKEGWPGIVAGALKLFKDLPKAMEGSLTTYSSERLLMTRGFLIARQALEDAFQEDSDDEDDIDETKLLNLNEDEGKSIALSST